MKYKTNQFLKTQEPLKTYEFEGNSAQDNFKSQKAPVNQKFTRAFVFKERKANNHLIQPYLFIYECAWIKIIMEIDWRVPAVKLIKFQFVAYYIDFRSSKENESNKKSQG